jgi:hypothetical protein
MVVVFGAFSFAGILPMKQLGLGMAVAIALDATVIRLVVVPASMRLMGDWNWWMPGRRAPARRAAGRARPAPPGATPPTCTDRSPRGSPPPEGHGSSPPRNGGLLHRLPAAPPAGSSAPTTAARRTPWRRRDEVRDGPQPV